MVKGNPSSPKSKIILYIAASMDGYIATADGGVEWLDQIPHPEGEDYGYTKFYQEVEYLVMGRKTYEDVLKITSEWPYPDRKSLIVTRKKDLPITTPKTSLISEELAAQIKELRKKANGHIWLMGGGELISSFLEKKLIDEIILFVAPTILGGGRPLFPESGKKMDWILTEAQHYPSGMARLSYRKST